MVAGSGAIKSRLAVLIFIMKKHLISLFALAMLFGAGLQAQQEDTSSIGFHVSIDPVVISANHTPVPKRAAPSLVGVVDSRRMEAAQSVSVGDALPFQVGVRVEDNCATCGSKQARINGLDGHYSQILIDSRPVLPAVAALFGLEQLPANMIERTEVMRGGGSALYGASAVGGTINIITRQPDRNSAYLSHSLMSIGGSGALDNTTSLGSSFVSKNDRAGATLFFQNRQRDGYSHLGDGFTTLPQLHMLSGGTHAFFRTGEFSKLDLTYFLMDDSRRGGNKLEMPVELANLAELNEHQMHNANANYHWNSEDNTWHADVFASVAAMRRHAYAGGYLYDAAPDPNAYKYHTVTRDAAVNGGAMLRYYFQRLWFMPANLTFGAEYSGDYLRDTALSYALSLHQNTHIASTYVQNEWGDETWDILLAARMDKHNLVEQPILSPRVAVRFSPLQGLDLRAGYSDGFRAPQVFDEDLHVSMAGGERRTVVMAADLKEERSHTANLSADYYASWGKTRMNFTAEGFLTTLNNVFAERELATPSATGDVQIEKYNGGGAKYYGVNLAWSTQIGSILSSDLGITLQRSRYDEAQQWSDEVEATTRIMRTPDVYGYLALCVTPWSPLDIDITGTYTGKMLVPHAASSGTPTDTQVESDPFLDLNLKASYTFALADHTSLELTAGVVNLFNSFQDDLDSGIERDSDYIYGPALPRSLTCGATLRF